MKVLRGISTNRNQSLMNPFPDSGRFFFELRGGDILHPIGSGSWFSLPYFSRIFRAFCGLCVLPFVAWKFGTIGGYIGAKAYGADSPEYCNWMNHADVFEGSHALMFSVRLIARGVK